MTPAQRRVLQAIADYVIANNGRTPCLRELGEALGDRVGPRSTSTVRTKVLALQTNGLLNYVPYFPRSIILTDAGWAAVGMLPCVCCGGTGRVRT